MNIRHLGALALASLLWASVAFAAAPVPGNYTSTDLGGPIPTGRYTEGWLPGGGAFLPGTTLNGQSWDGTALGTAWRYECATIASPAITISDNVDANGNGSRTSMMSFVGGTLWLSGSGPWAGGDADYPGVIDNYVEIETKQYFNHVEVAAVTNVTATGHFLNYPASCLTFAIANGVKVGGTPGVKPANYPDLLQAGTCAPGAPEGAWWNMLTLTLSVSGGCATPSRSSTWGALKAVYR